VRIRLGSAAAIAALAMMASCAPRLARPPETGIESRASRYRARLAEREARGVAMSATVVVWAERGGERLPGAQADLRLAAPDRMRLRIASAFGTALDLGLAGDSLRAYVPAWKTGLRLDAAAESLGFDLPGDRVVRALSATWRPPAEAWERAVWNDSLLRVAWLEGQDSLALEVGAAGLPVQVELSRPGGLALAARYRAWDRASGTAWPASLELADDLHDVKLACRASQIRFRPEPDVAGLAVRWPASATRLTLGELRAALDRLGVF
jgi:hypothetical protein